MDRPLLYGAACGLPHIKDLSNAHKHAGGAILPDIFPAPGQEGKGLLARPNGAAHLLPFFEGVDAGRLRVSLHEDQRIRSAFPSQPGLGFDELPQGGRVGQRPAGNLVCQGIQVLPLGFLRCCPRLLVHGLPLLRLGWDFPHHFFQ